MPTRDQYKFGARTISSSSSSSSVVSVAFCLIDLCVQTKILMKSGPWPAWPVCVPCAPHPNPKHNKTIESNE